MKRTTEIHRRFKQPDEEGGTRCSVIINGEYIFSPEQAFIIGSDLTEEFTTKKIYYSNDEELAIALKEMPDYKCWDSERKIITN